MSLQGWRWIVLQSDNTFFGPSFTMETRHCMRFSHLWNMWKTTSGSTSGRVDHALAHRHNGSQLRSSLRESNFAKEPAPPSGQRQHTEHLSILPVGRHIQSHPIEWSDKIDQRGAWLGNSMCHTTVSTDIDRQLAMWRGLGHFDLFAINTKIPTCPRETATLCTYVNPLPTETVSLRTSQGQPCIPCASFSSRSMKLSVEHVLYVLISKAIRQARGLPCVDWAQDSLWVIGILIRVSAQNSKARKTNVRQVCYRLLEIATVRLHIQESYFCSCCRSP